MMCSYVVFIQVMLIGGNFVVSKFLCALVSLASKDKAVLDNIEVHTMFIDIPTSPSFNNS